MKRRIIDFHVHFAGEDAIYQKDGDGNEYDYSINSILAEMNDTGTDYALISSIEPMIRDSWRIVNHKNGLVHGGNEKAAKAIEESNRRLIGAFVPYPYKCSEEIQDEIKYFVNTYNFRAIKLHPWLGGYPANVQEIYPVFEVASQLKLPVLYHSGTVPFTTPAEMFDMAKRFPKVPVIMGHSGGTELWHDVMVLAEYAENLYIETSGQSNRIFLQVFVKKFGSERVLYGSDWLGQPGKMLFRKLEIEELELTEDEKNNIFWNNAKRLLKL